MPTPEETTAAQAATTEQTTTEAPGAAATGTPPPTFDAWLEARTPEEKALLEGHTKGLKSALDSERETRKDLEKQVRDLAGKAEKGSEMEAQLTKTADSLADATRRADFMEAAHAAGVTNLKLAYTVAVQDEMFDRQGRPNFESMKAQYPELFASGKPVIPTGSAGVGTGTEPPPVADMNAFIRGSVR